MDCNVVDILPVVFYDLMRVHEVIAANPWEIFRRADLSVLTAEDLRRLTQGRGNLRGKYLDDIKYLHHHIRLSGCKRIPVSGNIFPGKSPCHAGLKKWWAARLGVASGHSVRDPIRWLREEISLCDDIPQDEACVCCVRTMKKRIQGVREELWTSLPFLFGLVSISSHPPLLVLTALTRIDGFGLR
jgi:hypothetical protein